MEEKNKLDEAITDFELALLDMQTSMDIIKNAINDILDFFKY